MIRFRCWYCGKRYAVAEARVGERLSCTCDHRLKVPRRSGGRSRAWTPAEWVIETAVYGGCGAALGFGLGIVLITQAPIGRVSLRVLGGLTTLGLLIGAVFGEAGINWIGRRIRSREEV